MKKIPRRKKLVSPRLQGRIIASFLLVSAVTILLQVFFVIGMLDRIASRVPESSAVVVTELGRLIKEHALLSFLVSLPLTLIVALYLTFRIAGPVRRFEEFLSRIERGESPQDCRIRESDELQELCRLLNSATLPLRQDAAPTEPEILDLRRGA